MVIVCLSQMQLWLEVKAEKLKKERKKKNLMPMRKELNNNGTIIIYRRGWVKKLRMWETQNLGMSECNGM